MLRCWPFKTGLALTAAACVSVPQVAVAQAPLTSRAELEAFLDGVMVAHLNDKHVAGATVSVVKDGRVLLAKGYGYADVSARTPVDPERTLFHAGSIGKLFTWTAVMQLVERNRLDLDVDVNTYLDFEIPATYEEPITLWHCLTHTPGLEEDPREIFARDSTALQPLGEWLADHLPARVRPPGTYSAYSNYCTALAGYIVQRVSGTSFDEYIEQNIFTPLGMDHSTTRQPPPAALAGDLSQGYKWTEGRFEPKPLEVANVAPAGPVRASAGDMARFMLAHLNKGVLDGARILSESTSQRMQERSFGHDPRLAGWALGFYEKSSHGLRIIGHGGDTQWFHSDLALIPSENLGVFVSYNTDTGGALSFGPFLEALLDHYYPTPSEPVALPTDAVERASEITGVYASNRRSYTTFIKAFDLIGATRVSADTNGVLVMQSSGTVTRLAPIGPRLYREELGEELVAFAANESGDVTHGFMGSVPMVALERLAWYQAPRLHTVVLVLALVVFAATALAAVGRVFRRRFGLPRPEDALPGRSFVVGLALLNLAFAVAMAALASDPIELILSPPAGLPVALALPVLGALLTVGAGVVAVRHWRHRAGTTAARVRYSAVVVVALLFLWSLNQWNLLGWRL